MRIISSIKAQLYMDMIRNSNAQKKARKPLKSNSLDSITFSNSANKVAKAIRSNGISSNRRVDESINLQKYIDEAKQKNEETIKNSGDKITARNSYVSEMDVCYEALHDKYSKLLKEAKAHSNPMAYIQDKYCNKNSPYYVSDLTDEERATANINEVTMLKYGRMNDPSMKDSLFRGISIYNSDEVENEKTFDRRVVNSEMDTLFKENGIELLEDDKLSFSIDPYSYNVTLSGIEDEGTNERIEELLNSGNNLSELYYHILSSLSASDRTKSTQFTRDGLLKHNLYHETFDVTQIDIRDLTERDGSYYTHDGEDITNIFNEKLEEMADKGKPYVPKQYTKVCEESFASMVNEVASKGWRNIPDMILSIDYSDKKLQDVYQNTNYSEDYEDNIYRHSKSSFDTLGTWK